jgi:hypothetical protein
VDGLRGNDKIYNGDRVKWLKLAYGLRALSLNHYSNKSSYDPAAVIADVDKSFASNADDALLPYPALSADNADRNFWGDTRDNITSPAVSVQRQYDERSAVPRRGGGSPYVANAGSVE